MRSFSRILFIMALAFAVPAFSQALVEHAAAASGASIGAAGGKVVSNGITSVFSRVDETTSKAAAPAPEKPKPEKPAALGPTTGAPAPGPIGSRDPSASTPRRHSRHSAKAPTSKASFAFTLDPISSTPVPVPIAERREPAVQDLLAVPIGAKEKDCIAALGAPSSRISIPEEGHMTELLRFSSRGQFLGTIRLDNGQVVDVQAANVQR